MISESPGYRLELGKRIERDSLALIPVLEEADKYEFQFRDHIVNHDHVNYVGLTNEKDRILDRISMLTSEAVIISISQKVDTDEEGSPYFRGLMRTPDVRSERESEREK